MVFFLLVLYFEDEKRRLSRMPLRGTEAPETIKRIVGYVLDWIPKANAQYTAHIKYQALQEQRAKEARRKAEIERLEKEIAISDLIAQL